MNIDTESLSRRLAELWWQEVYMKEHTYNEVYDVTLYESHGLHTIEEVREEHALVFWNRVDFYNELFDTYAITEEEGLNKGKYS